MIPDKHDFLGRGWSFPPHFVQGTGEVDMLTDAMDIRSSLEILLSTALGERTMLPQYGCNMDELIFESLNSTIKTLMEDKIKSAILYHESRILLEKVELHDENQDEGVILVEVTYTVSTTNTRYNFVFPYYKEEGTDINLSTTINLLPETR